MKQRRFTVEQIVSVPKESELGTPVAELMRKIGISEQTFYRWKKVSSERLHFDAALNRGARDMERNNKR